MAMDIALALETLGVGALYEGSTTRNDKAAFDRLRWSKGVVPPSWETVKAVSADRDATERATAKAKAHRDARAPLYQQQLGERADNTQIETIGDVLDTIIAQIAVLADGHETEDFAILLARIAQIKAENPKQT